MERPRLGEFLVAQGLLREEELARALELQRRSGERLGRILLALGYVRRKDLYRALSTLWGLPFVLLTEERPDPRLLRRWPLEEALRHRALPLRLRKDGTLLVAVSERPGEALEAALEKRFSAKAFLFLVTTDWDIDWTLRTYYKGPILDRAVYALYYRNPEESAYTVFTPGQYLLLALGVLGTLLGLYFHPRETLILLNFLVNAFFFVSVFFKFAVSLAGAWVERHAPVTEKEVRALKDEDLPTYTILVPVYREANVVGLLMRNLARMDYPKEKLEILVLI